VYIYLPTTQDQISFNVHPDMPVGPPGLQESNKGSTSSRTPLQESATPLAMAGSAMAGQKTPSVANDSESKATLATPRGWRRREEESSVPSECPEGGPLAEYLQELIEAYTGIPVEYQRLWCGCKVCPTNTLREQGINHGDTITLNMGDFDVNAVKTRMHDMARGNCAKKKSWVMPRWEHQASPRIIGGESLDMRLGQSVYFHDYRPLRDVGSIDPCGSMRNKFGSKSRCFVDSIVEH